MDEAYASLAYDGALLLCVPVCVSRALLVIIMTDGHNYSARILIVCTIKTTGSDYFHCLCSRSGVATTCVVVSKTRKLMRFAGRCWKQRRTLKKRISCAIGHRWR